MFALNSDDARVTVPESSSELAPTDPANRTRVLQQLCQEVSDEEITLLAQILTPDILRRINEYRAEYDSKEPEGVAGMEHATNRRTSPSPPSSARTPIVSGINQLPTRQSIMPINQIDVLSEQSTPPIDPHLTEPEIDNGEDSLIPRRRSRQTMKSAEMDYLPPLQSIFH